MKLQKFYPNPTLAPFIREYMIIETVLQISNHIMPDTSVVMAFRYKGCIENTEGITSVVLPNAMVTGLKKSVRNYTYSAHTGNLLVIFRESGIRAFSKVPAHELFNTSITSDNLFPNTTLNSILECLSDATSHEKRINIIEAFLLNMLRFNKPDLLVNEAIHNIKKQNGIIVIKDLAKSLYISHDSFEKRFRASVGTTPKQFASIVRMNHLVKNHSTYDSLTAASYDAGYYDQSHFIKDFRQFTGQTPTVFFKNTRFW